MHKVAIENAIFHAYHGVHEEERLIGGRFEVNVEIETDFSKAASKDDLTGTINYAAVYELIKSEMEQPSQLIEHVAQRILSAIKKQFSPIFSIEIQIKKCAPPISGEIDNVSITIRESEELNRS